MARAQSRNFGCRLMSAKPEATGASLNFQLKAAQLEAVDAATEAKFNLYLELILRWNARMNLTAIRSPNEIVSRHFVESIACAKALPQKIASLLDFGSGAGFPGIPIALCRPDIRVTLAESQNKKAGFLQEVVRTLDLDVRVFGGRAETLEEQFDCVTVRAVDQMARAVVAASKLVAPGGVLAGLTTEADRVRLGEATVGFQELSVLALTGSKQRVLVLMSERVNGRGILESDVPRGTS